MNATLRLAIAALLLALSPSPSPANVIYHLDTGLPRGQGITAEVVFAGPASATSGWTITSSSDVIGLLALDVPYVPPFHPVTTLVTVSASPLPQFFEPPSSSTGAHLDSGSISAIGWWYGSDSVDFQFGPGGSGFVEVSHVQQSPQGPPIVAFARGTWVLGPAPTLSPAPEPASLVLAEIACAMGGMAWGLRRAVGA